MENRIIRVYNCHNVNSLKREDFFKIPYKIALYSELIKDVIQDDEEWMDANDEDWEIEKLIKHSIPIFVSMSIIEKIVEFYKHYVENPFSPIEKPIKTNDFSSIVGTWYSEFIDIDKDDLFKMIIDVNYLNCPILLDFLISKFVTMVQGKNIQEIKEFYGITEDITEEEEEQARNENPWIFEQPISND